jgi:hypothetical protein
MIHKYANTYLDQPLKITPKQEQYSSFAPQFEMEFNPIINSIKN